MPWTQQHEATSRAYDFAYDPVDQLVGATYRTTDPVPSVLQRYGYVYDKVGNRTTAQVDDAPRVWAYNNTNQMISQAGGGTLRFEGSVNEPATVVVQGQPALVDAVNGFAGTALVAPGTPTVTVTATDGSGNSASQTYEVDVTDAPGSFVYDLNGNLTTHGTKTYEWDAENRLVRALNDGTEVARFTYDGLGRRAEKISGGVTRAYVYDGDDIVEERAGGTTTRIVHGPGIDQPLAAVTGSTPTYYLADHLGSIAQHTNAAQQVTLARTYDPFGNLTSGESASGYAFTGREWDAEVGLYYYRARYYDGTLGRFIGADPLGLVDGPNLYTYVRNGPTSYVDASGQQRMVPVDPVSGALADFIENYREMRRRNTKGADKYFHCMANCEASRRGTAGKTVAKVVSGIREWADEFIKGDPKVECDADRTANSAGRNGNPGAPCSTVCQSYKPPSFR